MKKCILTVLLAGLVFLLCACGGIGTPSKQVLKDAIPESVLQYTIGEENHSFSVDSFTLVREQTNQSEKSDYAEYEVVLKGEYLDRVQTLAFQSNYYDKGGWQVDDCYVVGTKSENYHDTEPVFRRFVEKKLPDICNVSVGNSKPLNYDTVVNGYSGNEIDLRITNTEYNLTDATHATVKLYFDDIQYQYVDVSGYLTVECDLTDTEWRSYNTSDIKTTYTWKNLAGISSQDVTSYCGQNWSYSIDKAGQDKCFSITLSGEFEFGFLSTVITPFTRTVDVVMKEDAKNNFAPVLESGKSEEIRVYRNGTDHYTTFKFYLTVYPDKVDLAVLY